MRNLIIALLLCSLSWISVSDSESKIVKVQSGEEVTLLCSNFSSAPTQMLWFTLVNRSQPQCVSFMFTALEHASFCGGFENGKFEMRSNLSTLFLKIKQVDLFDSGLYFCGYYLGGHPVIISTTYLEVQEVFDGITQLMSVILGSVVIFLGTIVICLTVKIKKLQKAHAEEQNQQQAEDELNYATVSFHPKPKRNCRPASEGQEDVCAINCS
uniref:uncharacterized protein LOC124054518 n=1 Tax=Scatophagus argus TaxID=75038 RepID=UPI001ED8127F|nr:uncharacterized protein LOC124054518 [Scatophagus argus]